MSRYKTYSEYKDSEVEWLGEIPKNWDIISGKRIFLLRNQFSDSLDQQLAVTQLYGVIPQNMFMERQGQRVALALKGTENFKHVEDNDFVISLRSFEGGIEYSAYNGCVSPAYTVLIPRPLANAYYFKYLFKSASYIAALQSSTDSLRDGKSIKYEQFGKIKLPIFAYSGQQKIADFLDYETSKIDQLINKQKVLIELLKEKRQALISQAVTKGLNPHVKMKDSGIEWLGNIKKEWFAIPIKYVVSTPITDGPHETPIIYDEGIPFVSAEAIDNGHINFNKIRGYISKKDNEKFSRKYKPKINDIYIVKSGATTGKIAKVETDIEFNIWSPLAAIRCDVDKIISDFAYFYFQSKEFQIGIELNWSYGTQQNIGMGVIQNLKIAVPNVIEQKQISNFLDNETSKIDKLLEKATKAVSLLQERRTALISAAVTGKIDVRDWQSPNTAGTLTNITPN